MLEDGQQMEEAENLNTSVGNIGLQWTTTQVAGNAYIANNASEEKLVISSDCERNTAGAGNAPYRFEFVAKWVNTSDSITSIRFFKKWCKLYCIG